MAQISDRYELTKNSTFRCVWYDIWHWSPTWLQSWLPLARLRQSRWISLGPGWWLEVLSGNNAVTVHPLNKSGGISITWTEDVRRVRLVQEIRFDNFNSDSDLQISYEAELSHESAAAVQWVAICEIKKSFSLAFVLHLPLKLARDGLVSRLTGFRHTVLPRSKRCAIAMELNAKGGRLNIHSFKLFGSQQAIWGKNEGEGQGTPAARQAALAASTAQTQASAMRRLAVVGWDLGHNPIGRSFVIADMIRENYAVELIGPLFKAYGSQIWEPLRDTSLPIRSFRAEAMRDFLISAVQITSTVTCDAIVVCKARLPSILLGLLIKHKNGCPLIIDVDDHELSFFKDRRPLEIGEFRAAMNSFPKEQFDKPFGEAWTRLAESLIDSMDGIIVSNVALRRRFGGNIVRHARDERKFIAAPRIRRRVRGEFGFSEEDKVILFLGTLRAHKGVFRLIEALERVDDPRLVLAVGGTIHDQRIANRLKAYSKARITSFPDQPWARLSELITMADAVFLLQDPDDPISQYQTPAKLAEALATSVPIVTTNVAPLADIPDDIVHRVHTDDEIDAKLRALAEGELARPGEGGKQRLYFIEEWGYRVNSARVRAAIAEANFKPATWKPVWTELLELLQSQFGVTLPTGAPHWAETSLPSRPRLTKGGPFDIAFFWKQNDSDIYGRRHDMMIKYLAGSDRVGRILQFDAPISITRLESMVSVDPMARYDQGNLIYATTIQRFLHLLDRGKVIKRTFVHSEPDGSPTLAGQQLRPASAYADFVKQSLAQFGTDRPLLAWVCPVVFDFPKLADQIDFSLIVADVIDDQRVMESSPSHLKRVVESYRSTLEIADVVLTNCEANQRGFRAERGDINVIPNAGEIFDLSLDVPEPPELEALQGPIIGYVGNLRSRIDIDLLRTLATERPQWNIVLIGSAHGEPEVFTLRHLANVHFLGVRPYNEIATYIRNFDVAIMPHLNNSVTEHMNPLKLYVYFGFNVPIVTTEVANIDEIQPYARVAKSHAEFVSAIEAALETPQTEMSVRHRELAEQMSWRSRVHQVLELIDRASV